MTVRDMTRKAFDWHRPLMAVGALCVGIAVVSAGGMLFDDRMLTGEPIWLKPFKFAVSLAIYLTSLAWLISLLRRGRKVASAMGTVSAVMLTIEMILLITQVVRGQRSHFNVATSFDTAVFAIMGAAIGMLWVANVVIGIYLLLPRQLTDRATAVSLRFGMGLAVAGMALGFLMPQPTPDQLTRLQNDEPVGIIGAHSVGVPDGGPGMPVTHWSTTGGDLRVPHFIGLHALQFLPLIVIGLVLLAARFTVLRDEATRVRLVWTLSLAYTAFLALITWQALRGQPLIAPDGITLATLGVIVLATGASIVATLTKAVDRVVKV